MAGLPTRLKVADLLFANLGIDDADRPWFMLGALGPAIGEFIPNQSPSPPEAGQPARTAYYQIWQQLFQLAVGNPKVIVPNSDPTQPGTPLPGVVPTLATIKQMLATLSQLVSTRDFSGVQALQGSPQLTAFNEASAALGVILRYFQIPSTLQDIGKLLGSMSEPKIDWSMTPVVLPTTLWTGREWLHGKQTGEFAAHLFNSAGDDPRFVAYAKGWSATYALLMSSSGCINSITGSTYRTYWWRSRWVENFVDAWVWGYYNDPHPPSLDGNTIQPKVYQSWVSLCAAGLHEWVDPSLIGGVTVDPMTLAAAVVADNGPLTQVLPEAFTTFWLDAWKNAYPSAPAEESSVFDATSLNAGYLMTWLVLWFQTSGAVIGCNPSPPQTPPSTCSAADNQAAQQWDNPTMINPATGEPYQPVVTKPVHDPRVAETVCGVILAILGAAATALGGAGFGIPLILGGIGLAVDGEEQLNWDQLECNLYWLNMYLWNGLDALRKIAILGGFQYPEATDLAISGYTSIAYGAEALSYLSAPTMCQSQSLDKILAPWGASLVTASGGMFVASWTSYPTGAAEEYNPPALPVWDRPGLWPCAFIDDPQHRNPATANILNSPADYDSGVEGSFGPALANAARVIDAASKGTAPPNWNLDGDRGLGWATWQLQAPYSSTISDPLQTERES